MTDGHVERLSLWRRSGNALAPVSPDAVKALERIAEGERVWLTADRRRSLRQHRLFRKILQVAAEATEFEKADVLNAWLKERLGKFTTVKIPRRKEPLTILRSTAFDAMSEAEFTGFMDDAIRLIFSEVLPASSRDDVIAECEALLGPEPRQ